MCNKVIYLSLVLMFSFIGFVKGSCLEYGHSCWGAHGKRSGGKIYRSIDGSESQPSKESKDVIFTQDKIKPSELLSILLDRNGHVNLDEARNLHDLSLAKNENQNIIDAPEQRLRRRLRDAFRKGVIFHYLPKDNDFIGLRSSTETSPVRHNQDQLADSSTDYEQVANYPSINFEMDYLDLK